MGMVKSLRSFCCISECFAVLESSNNALFRFQPNADKRDPPTVRFSPLLHLDGGLPTGSSFTTLAADVCNTWACLSKLIERHQRTDAESEVVCRKVKVFARRHFRDVDDVGRGRLNVTARVLCASDVPKPAYHVQAFHQTSYGLSQTKLLRLRRDSVVCHPQRPGKDIGSTQPRTSIA